MDAKYNSDNIRSIKYNNNYFLINWHVTGWCNFKCEYCINNELAGAYTSEEKVNEVAEGINRFIKEKVPKTKEVHLRLIGGEPAYYDWFSILDKIEYLNRITMITNFSRDNKFYLDLYDYCATRQVKLYLICSDHKVIPNFVTKFMEVQRYVHGKRNIPEYRAVRMPLPQLMTLVDTSLNLDTLMPYYTYNVKNARISIARDHNQNHVKLTDGQMKLLAWYDKLFDSRSSVSKPKPKFEVELMDDTIEAFKNQTQFTNLLDDGFNPQGFRCSSGINVIGCLPNGDIILNKCDYLKNKIIGNICEDLAKLELPKTSIECLLNSDGGSRKCPLCFGTSIERADNYYV